MVGAVNSAWGLLCFSGVVDGNFESGVGSLLFVCTDLDDGSEYSFDCGMKVVNCSESLLFLGLNSSNLARTSS